jgi:hypothetical protein
MKALKIIILLLVMGVTQATATGFSYNMNQAQKMLKAKKMHLVKDKKTTTEVQVKSSEREPGKVESVRSETSVTIRESEEQLSEKAVGTFVQWVSNFLLKLLIGGAGR